jgi:hypothetical protein
MKTIIFLASALAFALPVQAAESQGAFERRCESELKPVYDVKLQDFGYQVDNTVSSRVLNNRDLRSGYGGGKVLGLTTVQTRTEVLTNGKLLVDPKTGRECVAPVVEVAVQFPRIDVYVAREFSPVSCSFRYVLAHEMRHVQLYRDIQPRLREMIRDEMQKQLGAHPLYGKVGAGMHTVDEFVDNMLRPMIQAQLAQLEETQKQIDSDEEAYRLSSACQGEIFALMDSRF